MKTDELGTSLLAAFAREPDVRSRQGRRAPLPALLTLATAALLAGARSLYAISQWGRLQPEAVRRALGFPDGGMPAATTLHDAFKRLDVAGFEAALRTWAVQALKPNDRHLVLDGKALRGMHGEELPGVSLVAVYAPEAGLVLAHAGGRTKEEQAETEEGREQAKQEAELSVAPHLVRQVGPLLGGWLVSGDALSYQKNLCRQIAQAGGAYLFAVKANPPDLLDDVTLFFREPPPGERFATAAPVDKHGGRLERRQVRASATLASYLQAAGWPAVGLVLEVATTVRWPHHPAGGTSAAGAGTLAHRARLCPSSRIRRSWLPRCS